jgi:predicted DNA-binding transcriptional regulator AlpA
VQQATTSDDVWAHEIASKILSSGDNPEQQQWREYTPDEWTAYKRGHLVARRVDAIDARLAVVPVVAEPKPPMHALDDKNILRMKDLVLFLGIARSTINERRKDPDFPKPIRLGGPKSHDIGWYRSEAQKYLDTRPRV